MKVILLENIEKLGGQGSIVEVKDGFARNYLIPQRKALEATASNISFFKTKEEREKRKEERERQKFLKVAQELSKLSLTIPSQVKQDEEIFGSVTPQMIVLALKNEGYQIGKEAIIIDEPIKRLGIYKIKVKLYQDVSAELKVWVVKK